jgi:hypothetical protein
MIDRPKQAAASLYTKRSLQRGTVKAKFSNSRTFMWNFCPGLSIVPPNIS